MKKNISINLFGTLYAIDEDAYELLERYLDSMREFFGNSQSGKEIADDIEHRVAELLWQKRQEGMEAVCIDDIRFIISKIGSAKDIDPGKADDVADAEEVTDVQGDDDATEHASGSKDHFSRLRTRRLFRDPDNQVVAGVCSGLARYFGKGDVILWRLAFLFLGLVPWLWGDYLGSTIPIVVVVTYITLMVVMPLPRTPEDRLRMNGEEVTAEAINEELLRESAQKTDADPPRQNNGAGCLKALLIVVLCLMVLPVAIVFMVSLFLLGVVGVAQLGFVASVFPSAVSGDLSFIAETLGLHSGMVIFGLICLMLVVGLPLWLIIRAIRGTGKKRSAAGVAACIVLWLCSIVGFVFAFTSVVMNLQANYEPWVIDHHDSVDITSSIYDDIDEAVADTVAVDSII